LTVLLPVRTRVRFAPLALIAGDWPASLISIVVLSSVISAVPLTAILLPLVDP